MVNALEVGMGVSADYTSWDKDFFWELELITVEAA
jgi:hypothetical protein